MKPEDFISGGETTTTGGVVSTKYKETRCTHFHSISGLPYGVICKSPTGYKFALHQMNPNELTPFGKGVVFDFGKTYYIGDIKPYLRPMSSMTEEEKNELKEYLDAEEVDCNGFGYSEGGTLEDYISSIPYSLCVGVVDWLNKHHFDYRGLIEKGLAIEITENNNPYKDN